MENLPGPLRAVALELSKLPGLGPKSALRIALTMLKMPKEKVSGIGKSIIDLRESLCICEECASITESCPCRICSDPGRERDKLCLVSEWDSLLAIEEMGLYRGYYLVLGGLLSPLDGVSPQHLEFNKLEDRLAKGQVTELILALGATVEAEATASYVKNMVQNRFSQISLSRFAQGIPIGTEVKHTDKETLRQALEYRQKL
ncbi:recombination mediator RecR [Maridesulfovibrio frigidus]|uniref:recombination mediator RecR n=1 Tax=Maridesulfovibrio frigidus TaxID=340956 RepID=UPI0004E19E48|nr:recombination mediator RecR [Maridesulfovibrio frigidus]